MTEEWRSVSGYEGLYEVSNLGRVRSLDRLVQKGEVAYKRKGRILKQTPVKKSKYLHVYLFKNGVKKAYQVHRLVAYAFIPQVEGKNVINHKDGNGLNNAVDNLEWCTQSENVVHALKTGLSKDNNYYKNEKEIIADYKSGKTILEISAKYNCNRSTISKHLKRLGFEIRNVGDYTNKYNIPKLELIEAFEIGTKNKELVEKYNCSKNLISYYKRRWKNGELKREGLA